MQRIILRQLKASVFRIQGVPSPEIEKYYQSYRRELQKYQKVSNKVELLKDIRNSDIVFGADFHPFAQSQRTHLRILRELVKGKRPLILALESVYARHQISINEFLSDKIDDKTFLRKIDYSQKWGFPWENYKVLFDFAKTYKVQIVGINSQQRASDDADLEKRDKFSAGQIAKVRKENPRSLIYVIYGDLHLAKNRLPRLTKIQLGKSDKSKFITVFQNSETLYWRLAKRKLEERVDVLKLRPGVYCVVNSPPWLKWQAYLSFLENTVERDADNTDQIFHFVKFIQNIWGIERNFSDFSIFSNGDMRFAQYLSEKMTKLELDKITRMIRQNRSFFIPSPPIFYLQTFDVNNVAALAGQYIHSKFRNEKKVHLNFPDDLIPQIWIEAVGFFASQLVNSRRKFSTLKDLPSKHSVTLLVLEEKLLEQMAIKTSTALNVVRKARLRKTSDYIEAARILGAILGNKMYTAFRTGELTEQELHGLLRRKVAASEKFYRFYVDVLISLKDVIPHERSKNERL